MTERDTLRRLRDLADKATGKQDAPRPQPPPELTSAKDRLKWRMENYTPEQKAAALRRLVEFVEGGDV